MPRLRLWSAALVAALLVPVALTAAPGAGAHTMPTSAVLLDIGTDRVGGEIDLPLDRLAIALGRTITAQQATGVLRGELLRYVRSHVAATGADGRAWTVDVTSPRVATIDGVQDLVLDLTLTPPDGAVTSFDLRYDAVIEQLVTHKALAAIRTQWDRGTLVDDPVSLGVFDSDTTTLRVDADGGSWVRGLTASAGLGVSHVTSGADHLLFLLMLLVPAPLVAVGGRWRRRDDARAATRRVIHVVTAFALGHSLTLALGTLGLVHVPGAVVEPLVALSILVSAVHAIRPLVPGGEAAIAGGFGLVHGLAFASLLQGIGLHGPSLVSMLAGFNLGIELTQLLVVALVMPSLWMLSRSAAYPLVRAALAVVGIALSAGWLLDRTGVISVSPLDGIEAVLVHHRLVPVAGLAVLAALCRLAPGPAASAAAGGRAAVGRPSSERRLHAAGARSGTGADA